MEYQYWVQQDYDNSIAKRYGMSIDEYYDSVIKHLPSTTSSDEHAFEPIQLDLKLSKDVCVPLSVAVTDANWYERLQQVVTDTYFRHKVRDHPERVKIVDVTRKDIRGLSPDQLAVCGKVRAFVGDEWLVVDSPTTDMSVVDPPTALRNDKQTQLVKWFDNKAKERIVQATAKQLANCDQQDIFIRTKVDGPLDKDIRQILRETVPGGTSNVMATFGVTERVRAASAESAIARASETILRQIRQGLRTNQVVVERNIKSRIASSLVARKDDDEAPLFDSLAAAPEHSAAQEQKLYQGIARKALTKSVVNIINHFYRGVGCDVCQTKTKQKKAEDQEEDEGYYSDYYYGKVNKRFADKFHSVAGRAIFMEPRSVAAAPVATDLKGLRGARLRKKIGDRPRLMPIGDSNTERPRLVPIGDAEKPKLVSKAERPRLVPIDAPIKPKLVPIDMDDDAPLVSFKVSDAQKPRLVPNKPKLVPIDMDDDTPLVSFKFSDANKPKLVPIGNEAISLDHITRNVEPVNDGMPDFLDFLKMKRTK